MWPWPLMLICALNWASHLAGATALAAPSSLGPTSATEAALLWKDGKAAFDTASEAIRSNSTDSAMLQLKYQDAITRLQRLIDRYPGSPDYSKNIEAHRFLGEAYLKIGKPEKAIAPLRYFSQAAPRALPSLEAWPGKLSLGEAYLATRRYHEAYLLSQEFDSIKEPLLSSWGMLLKARSLIGLNRDPAAELLLEELNSRGLDQTEFLGEFFLTQLQLKTKACAKLPSARKMEEDQVRLQLERRGLCLQEAINLYGKYVARVESRFTLRANTFLERAYQGYQEACLNPPAPPPLRPKERTPVQLKKYRSELAESLKVEYKKSVRTSIELLEKKNAFPLIESLRQILGRLDTPHS